MKIALFENLIQQIKDAYLISRTPYTDEKSSDEPDEEVECMECDGMTPCPIEASPAVEKVSDEEYNMLLDKENRFWGEM